MTENARFFIPGPTWVRPEILAEMSHPMVGHRGAEFVKLLGSIYPDLRSLFRTSGEAFVATCSGTALLEAALVNCVSRRVLVTVCGAFSERWLAIAKSIGLEADVLEVPWGKAIDPSDLASHFRGRRYHYDAVTITHNETSTGVMNDLESLSAVVREESRDTLVLVDAVSSLAAAPLEFDAWQLDVCVASVQKGIALPPGIAVFSASERAFERAAKKPYRGTYFDFLEYRKRAAEGTIPFTPSIPHYFALGRQLEHIMREETLEARWERHRRMRDITLERTAPYAEPMADLDVASMSVSTLRPRRKPAAEILAAMKQNGFTLGSGYGEWKGEGFRIGHMGDITIDALNGMLNVLETVAT